MVFSSAAGIERLNSRPPRYMKHQPTGVPFLVPFQIAFYFFYSMPALVSPSSGSLSFPFPLLHFSSPLTFLSSPSLPLPPQTMLISSFSLACLLATFSCAHTHRSQHPPRAFSPGFPYGSQKVRGVNLGGWLLIEVRYCPSPPLRSCILTSITAVVQPWIKPSLFDNTGNPAIVDEWTFGLLQDRSVAQSKLVEHWNTWITEADFKAIAAAGCVFVV